MTDSSLRKVLVIKSGEHPLELTAFPYTDHPAYRKGLLKEVDIKNMIKPISVRMAEIKMAEKQTVTDGMGTTYDRDLVKEGIINLIPRDMSMADSGNDSSFPKNTRIVCADPERDVPTESISPESSTVSLHKVQEFPESSQTGTPQRRRRKRSRTVTGNSHVKVNTGNSSELDD